MAIDETRAPVVQRTPAATAAARQVETVVGRRMRDRAPGKRRTSFTLGRRVIEQIVRRLELAPAQAVLLRSWP